MSARGVDKVLRLRWAHIAELYGPVRGVSASPWLHLVITYAAVATTLLSRRQVLKGLLAGAVAGTSSVLFAVGNGAGSSAENYAELIERKGDHEGI